MKKMLAVMLIVSVFFLAGCRSDRGKEGTTDAPEPERAVNFLTGLEGDMSPLARPVAVTVNNIEQSLPQYGISGADVIMEFPVEGGITRLMALYGDYKSVPEVCSVRSCRYYFPIFARGFDAVYFCYGSNETLATPTLEGLGMDFIDGNQAGDSLVFERDNARLEDYSPEHTVYLKGRNMAEIFERYGFSSERDEALGEAAFKFADERVNFTSLCTEITAEFSSSYYSDFYYDSQIGEYVKSHNGQPHTDRKSGEVLSFTNVLLLEAETALYNGTSLVELDWHGGNGLYATNGTVTEILWKKEGAEAALQLFDTAGNPLEINKGKSYIGVGAQAIISGE